MNETLKVMTKGDLMALLFTKEELGNVDAAFDHAHMKNRGGTVDSEDTFWYVTDYNDNFVFGKLVDMRVLAKSKNVNLETI